MQDINNTRQFYSTRNRTLDQNSFVSPLNTMEPSITDSVQHNTSNFRPLFA